MVTKAADVAHQVQALANLLTTIGRGPRDEVTKLPEQKKAAVGPRPHRHSQGKRGYPWDQK